MATPSEATIVATQRLDISDTWISETAICLAKAVI